MSEAIVLAQIAQARRRAKIEITELDALVDSGTYTPTLTGVVNVTGTTANQCFYSRNNSVVTVSGIISVDPTAAGDVQVGISLPVASAFATAYQCAGVGGAPLIAGLVAAIIGDSTNDRAVMRWNAVDTTNQEIAFTFQYLIV